MLRFPLLPTCFLLALFSVSSTYAQLGESPRQCQVHYGSPLKAAPGVSTYGKSGLTMMISFYQGQAQAVLFRKTSVSVRSIAAPLSNWEIEQLKQANAGGHAWKVLSTGPSSQIWMTEDGERTAMYNLADHTLLIMDKGAADRRRVAQHLLKVPFDQFQE